MIYRVGGYRSPVLYGGGWGSYAPSAMGFGSSCYSLGGSSSFNDYFRNWGGSSTFWSYSSQTPYLGTSGVDASIVRYVSGLYVKRPQTDYFVPVTFIPAPAEKPDRLPEARIKGARSAAGSQGANKPNKPDKKPEGSVTPPVGGSSETPQQKGYTPEDVAKIRKALADAGVTDSKKQDEAIGSLPKKTGVDHKVWVRGFSEWYAKNVGKKPTPADIQRFVAGKIYDPRVVDGSVTKIFTVRPPEALPADDTKYKKFIVVDKEGLKALIGGDGSVYYIDKGGDRTFYLDTKGTKVSADKQINWSPPDKLVVVYRGRVKKVVLKPSLNAVTTPQLLDHLKSGRTNIGVDSSVTGTGTSRGPMRTRSKGVKRIRRRRIRARGTTNKAKKVKVKKKKAGGHALSSASVFRDLLKTTGAGVEYKAGGARRDLIIINVTKRTVDKFMVFLNSLDNKRRFNENVEELLNKDILVALDVDGKQTYFENGQDFAAVALKALEPAPAPKKDAPKTLAPRTPTLSPTRSGATSRPVARAILQQPTPPAPKKDVPKTLAPRTPTLSPTGSGATTRPVTKTAPQQTATRTPQTPQQPAPRQAPAPAPRTPAPPASPAPAAATTSKAKVQPPTTRPAPRQASAPAPAATTSGPVAKTTLQKTVTPTPQTPQQPAPRQASTPSAAPKTSEAKVQQAPRPTTGTTPPAQDAGQTRVRRPDWKFGVQNLSGSMDMLDYVVGQLGSGRIPFDSVESKNDKFVDLCYRNQGKIRALKAFVAVPANKTKITGLLDSIFQKADGVAFFIVENGKKEGFAITKGDWNSDKEQVVKSLSDFLGGNKKVSSSTAHSANKTSQKSSFIKLSVSQHGARIVVHQKNLQKLNQVFNSQQFKKLIDSAFGSRGRQVIFSIITNEGASKPKELTNKDSAIRDIQTHINSLNQ